MVVLSMFGDKIISSVVTEGKFNAATRTFEVIWQDDAPPHNAREKYHEVNHWIDIFWDMGKWITYSETTENFTTLRFLK